MKQVGLYFGTFNPVHIGHVVIANYMAHHTHLDEVWMVVTPHNPHKERANLLPDEHRLQMVRLAIFDNNKVWASDVEFSLPQPNYTIHTLEHLESTRTDLEFTLIMGEDNLRKLHHWKGFEEIVKKYPILVYPRAITEGEDPSMETSVEGANIQVCNA
ncbi:MAG: nicotinate-nucleotide adenylyltransferase, partial [Flavobacteriales bacterium]|nr:nicotinate-nucleotide adenylyltransferase [Flavobacteriales bacterium]